MRSLLRCRCFQATIEVPDMWSNDWRYHVIFLALKIINDCNLKRFGVYLMFPVFCGTLRFESFEIFLINYRQRQIGCRVEWVISNFI